MNALMPNFDLDPRNKPHGEEWQGFAEVDEAIRENRLVEFRFRKSWADPWGRKLTIAGGLVIVAVFAYLIGSSLRIF
ncbi:hypothetical protein [Croceicoccus mobilis]|uniref:Uncharacterized protein n=1 Tax=Croceicoccus mobilis TaxID=1703339 RepID=A0A916Z6B1_9SPHN|nr:hypothetical protein [Croceicoccus mobilis]GGD76865.1 hypothetical protein GCM10010990_28220 [Croceicoccus mobilis]